MKTNRYILTTLLLACIYIYNTNAQETVINTHKIPVDNDTKDLMIVADAKNGSINITGYNSNNEVVIDVVECTTHSFGELPDWVVPETQPFVDINQLYGNNDTIDTEGLKKIKSKSKGYEIIKEGNKIYITSNQAFGGLKSYGFNINVPANCSIIAKSFGNIELTSINGDFELNTVLGSINAKDLTGSVVANSTNGRIKVQISKANPDALMAFSSVSGHVDVTLPADIKATFKMNSDFGEIYSNFDMETKNNDIVTSNNRPEKGKYKYKVKNWTMADINGGGAEIIFKTLSGNIYIRKR